MKIDAHMHLTIPVETMVDKLREQGFDRGIVCSSAVARGECVTTLESAQAIMGQVADVQNQALRLTASQVNHQIMEAVSQYPQLLWGFGKVDLFQPDLEATMDEIVALGMKGVGEIVGLHGNVDRLAPVLELAGARGLPVFLHTDYPVDADDLARVFELAGRYPETQIILGHMGGDFWIDAIQGASKLPNVWVDTSEVVNQVALQVAVNTIPGRVLFSTDYPWDSMESMVAHVQVLQNSEAEKQAVLGGNAERLFSR